MTDDKLQSIKDDIAYMKALAQEGRQAPILGGAILIAAGLIFATASLGQWALIKGVLPWGVAGSGPLWLGALAIFFVVLFALVTRMKSRAKAGATSAANRASRAVWTSTGYTIFALGIVLVIAQIRLKDPAIIYLFPSLILALYGTGWAVNAAMAGHRWMTAAAFVSWGAAIGVSLLSGTADQYLAYAAALVVCTLLPGVKMVREEPSDVV